MQSIQDNIYAVNNLAESIPDATLKIAIRSISRDSALRVEKLVDDKEKLYEMIVNISLQAESIGDEYFRIPKELITKLAEIVK